MGYKIRFIVVLSVVFNFITWPVYSQVKSSVSNLSQVEVDKLTDEQMSQLVSEINRRGLTESQAISMARARGMSQIQVDQLKKRLTAFKGTSGGVVSTSSNNQSLKSEVQIDLFEGLYSEKAIIDSTMVDRRIFGFQFFNAQNLSFEPNLTIPVSSSYVIGSGDELIISIWGMSEQVYQLTVDRNGNVVIPQVGLVSIGSLTLESAKHRLVSSLSTIYSDLNSSSPRTFIDVSLNNLKAIKVHVIGEVFVPGTYTLPGTSSAFNALYLCGGPNRYGTFRDIQVLRNGKKVATLDVYDFLINGNSSVNVSLRDNDVILVSPYLNRVKMGGEFKRPGFFESKEGETIHDLIRFAGGYTEIAFKDRIELYRIDGRQRIFKNVFKEEMSSLALLNGDSLYCGSVDVRIDNQVKISGAVFRPGTYEYKDGMSLKDLIDFSGGVIENAFLNRGIVTRLKEDYTTESFSLSMADIVSGQLNFALRPNDEVFIASIDQLREKQTVTVWGEVQRMGVYNFFEKMTLGQLVIMAGGFTEAASETSIEVTRRLPYKVADSDVTKYSEIFHFEVGRDLNMADEGANFELKPFDEVSVKFMPGYTKTNKVEIWGQVMHSGAYGLKSINDRISDLVQRAGGITPYAYTNGAKLYRKIKLWKQDLEKREDLMMKDSTLRFSNLSFEIISIDLEKILREPGCKEDIYLVDGDELQIPAQLQTVKMSGEVLNPSSTVFTKGWSTKRYVNMSGGFSMNAKVGKTYVLYPNGSSSATSSILFFRRFPKITPGAEIIVPKRPERERLSAQAWIGIGTGMASMALIISNIVK